jgi:hypothetical protein
LANSSNALFSLYFARAEPYPPPPSTSSGQAYSQNGSRGAVAFKVPLPSLGKGCKERDELGNKIFRQQHPIFGPIAKSSSFLPQKRATMDGNVPFTPYFLSIKSILFCKDIR